MVERPRTSAGILAKVYAARFAAEGDFKGNPLFIKELRTFKKFQDRSHKSSVTLPAIAGWFRANAAEPTRVEALEFLLDYLLWTTSRPTIAGQVDRKATDALIGEFRRTVEFLRAPQGADTGNKRSTSPTIYRMEEYTLRRLEPIAGVYQIIRPYTSVVDAYVLEAFSINPHAPNAEQIVHMYSHTQPRKEHLYNGSASVNNKYCFAAVSREHEQHKGVRTSRALVLDISAPEACLSGLMLRGVTGRSGNWATAVPFVAIRTSCDMSTLLHEEVRRIGLGLYQIQDGLVLGDIDDKRPNAMFEFCDALFKQVKALVHNSNGFSLQTIDSRHLCELIDGEATSDEAYFNAWKEAVEVTIRPAG